MGNWSDEFEGSVTICDLDGVITYLNKTSRKQFEKYGGADLIGKNLLDCHPEPSRNKLKEQLKNPATNTYTIEKGDIKKIIHQSPLYENGVFSGVIEISFVIPEPMPHFIRE